MWYMDWSVWSCKLERIWGLKNGSVFFALHLDCTVRFLCCPRSPCSFSLSQIQSNTLWRLIVFTIFWIRRPILHHQKRILKDSPTVYNMLNLMKIWWRIALTICVQSFWVNINSGEAANNCGQVWARSSSMVNFVETCNKIYKKCRWMIQRRTCSNGVKNSFPDFFCMLWRSGWSSAFIMHLATEFVAVTSSINNCKSTLEKL